MEHFDKDGQPISWQDWALKFEDKEYRRVEYTQLPNGTTISTVWLGAAHGYGPNGAYIFETLVRPTGEEDEIYRYSTLEEAVADHAYQVDLALVNPILQTGIGLVVDDEDIGRWHDIIEEGNNNE